MAEPFPIPKKFKCQYCDYTADFAKFDPITSTALYDHTIKERKLVGQRIAVILHTHHLTAVRWKDGEWQHAPHANLHSARVCERVESESRLSAWESCLGGVVTPHDLNLF